MGGERGRRHFLRVGTLAAAGWVLAPACQGETLSTQNVPIAHPLPEREEARYRLLDSRGREQGTALLRIASEGEQARLMLDYDFGLGQKDRGVVIVRRDNLKPVRAEREVIDGDRRYLTRMVYGERVTVELDDGQHTQRREAELPQTAYDNLAALFLWRTMPHSLGVAVRYTNVLVNPRRGTISRAPATIEVVRREEVVLPAGSAPAWRLDFRTAGVTNSAWYRADASRVLLRYAITRGPTLILTGVDG